MNKSYNYDMTDERLEDAAGNAPAAIPSLTYGEKPTWALALTAGGAAADLSGVASWRAAVDTDVRSDTGPLCRTVSGISASGGVVSVPLDTCTEPFRQAVDGRRETEGLFELKGLDSSSRVVLDIIFEIRLRATVDAAGITDGPVPALP